MKQLQAPKTLLDRPIHLEKNHKPLETLGPRAIIKNGNKSAPTHRRTPQGGLGQGKGGGGGLIRDDFVVGGDWPEPGVHDALGSGV